MSHTSKDLAHAARLVEQEMGLSILSRRRLGGTDSTNVKVRTSGGQAFVLKVADEDVVHLAQAQCGCELMAILATLPTRLAPSLLRALDGRSVIPFESSGRSMHVSVMQWMPGKHPVPVTPKRAALIGRALGELSASLSCCQHTQEHCGLRYDIDRLLLRPLTAIRQSEELRRRHGSHVEVLAPKAIAFLECVAGHRIGWLHGDAHPWNMRVCGDRIYILDFDEAGVGPYSWELAVPLYFVRAMHPGRCRELSGIMTSSYCEAFPLERDELAAVEVFSLLRALVGMEYESANRSRATGTLDIARHTWESLLTKLDEELDEWFRTVPRRCPTSTSARDPMIGSGGTDSCHKASAPEHRQKGIPRWQESKEQKRSADQALGMLRQSHMGSRGDERP